MHLNAHTIESLLLVLQSSDTWGQQQFDMLKQYRIGGSLDKNKFTKLIVAHVIRECTSLYYLCAYLQ